MNWLDIVIVLIVTLSAFFGYRKGFVRKIFGIIGILAGFFIAVRFYGNVFDLLSKFIKSDPLFVKALSFLLILTIVYLIFLWIATFMASMSSGTKIADKIAGAITGFIQGLIIASVLLVNLSYMNFPEQQVRDSSLLYPTIYKIAPAIFDRIIEITPGIKSTYEEYKQLFGQKK
jgi:membrane protein required for colicin V production